VVLNRWYCDARTQNRPYPTDDREEQVADLGGNVTPAGGGGPYGV
jgi:hypothetical protein